jgi:hypothetical protein
MLRAFAAVVLLALATACGDNADNAPAVGAIGVSLSRPRVALGSPVEVSYTFSMATDAPALGARTVFVHFLDANEELMWVDDHVPPTPTTEWKPGQRIEYTRTMFVGRYPYVGAATVVAGLYSPETNERVKFSNEDRGDRSYVVADFELLPQTENIFLIFKDGWHQTEVVADGSSRVEWQWTKKEATVAFRNPTRDVVRHAGRQPESKRRRRARMEVRLGDQALTDGRCRADSFRAEDSDPRRQLGTADMVELRFIADKTFVPALGQRPPATRVSWAPGVPRLRAIERRQMAEGKRQMRSREVAGGIHGSWNERTPLAGLSSRLVPSACCLFLLALPATAFADLVVFKTGRTMSVASARLEGDRLTVILREGGEANFPSGVVARVDPDEVPYPAAEVTGTESAMPAVTAPAVDAVLSARPLPTSSPARPPPMAWTRD